MIVVYVYGRVYYVIYKSNYSYGNKYLMRFRYMYIYIGIV